MVVLNPVGPGDNFRQPQNPRLGLAGDPIWPINYASLTGSTRGDEHPLSLLSTGHGPIVSNISDSVITKHQSPHLAY